MKRFGFLVSMLLLVVLGGCQEEAKKDPEPAKAASAVAAEDSAFFTFTDFDGVEVTLEEKPQNVVLLKEEVVHTFYQIGGEAAGLVTDFIIDSPAAAKDVPRVGFMHEVNVEEVLALKPDLVIGQRFTHPQLRETFEQAGVPFANLNTQSVKEIKENALLLGKIIDKEEETKKLVANMEEEIEAVIAKVPENPDKTFAILTVMGDAVFVEQGHTVTVDMAKQLKLTNITESLTGEVFAGYLPFSLEEMVKLDPDYLFVLSHGSEEDSRKFIDTTFKQNDAWNSLSAVKEDRMHFLPPSKFVIAPGLDAADSYEHLAGIVFPEIFAGTARK